jgi:hypothetical protein
MRKAVFVFIGAFAVPIACVNSSDTPPLPPLDAGEGDASFPPYDGGLPDYSAPDQASPDAADAAPPPATVLVLKDGVPVSGVLVVFGDATGARQFADLTGQDGKIAHAVVADAMVTALLGGDGDRRLLTFVGVKPGDTLTVADATLTTGAPSANLQLDPSPPAGAASYDARVGACESLGSESPLSVFLGPGCSAGGKFPALVYSIDANAAVNGFSFKKGNALAADAGATDVPLGPWSTTFGTVTVGFTNAPQAQSIVVQQSELADRVSTAFRASIAPDGGAGQSAFKSPTGFADAFQPQVNVYYPNTSAQASICVMAKHVAAGANLTQSFDLAQLLPKIDGITIDLSTSTRPKVDWTSSGALTATDGGIVRIAGQHDAGDSGTEPIAWMFVVPPGTTSLTAPELTPGSPWTPNRPNFYDLNVVFVESDLLPSYDALRAGYSSFVLADYANPLAMALPPMPADGSLRLTANVPLPR